MNTGYGRIGRIETYGALRPSQAAADAITVTPGNCHYFPNALSPHQQRICNPLMNSGNRYLHTTTLPAQFLPAFNLFQSRGMAQGTYSPEEMVAIQEMMAYAQRPTPTPGGMWVMLK